LRRRANAGRAVDGGQRDLAEFFNDFSDKDLFNEKKTTTTTKAPVRRLSPVIDATLPVLPVNPKEC